MHIFYASDTTPNPAFHSHVWRNNLYLSLLDLGHEVTEFQYDLSQTFRYVDKNNELHNVYIERNRPRLSRALINQIESVHRANPIDLFFSYFYDACVFPEIIDAIRALGITTVNWYCNGSYQLHLVSEIAPHYDWCLVPERFRLKDYESIGARPIYCQEAANPCLYHPHDLPTEFDVTFVGQAYGNRPLYIRHLLDSGIDVRVWGYGWEKYQENSLHRGLSSLLKKGVRLFDHRNWQMAPAKLKYFFFNRSDRKTVGQVRIALLPPRLIGPPLADAEMIRIFSRSKINLGFSICAEPDALGNTIRQVRLRDFEVPMSGGFYMVEYMEELEEFFRIGKEIVCYTTPEDLAEKIKYYLCHEAAREQIRRAGYERCLRDHTWQKRFQQVFERIGLAGQ